MLGAANSEPVESAARAGDEALKGGVRNVASVITWFKGGVQEGMNASQPQDPIGQAQQQRTSQPPEPPVQRNRKDPAGPCSWREDHKRK